MPVGCALPIRHVWLTDQILEVHAASHGTYGARRVHAELTLGRGLVVGHGTVELLMARASIRGVTGRPRWRRPTPDLISADLVEHNFARSGPNQLWVTDITEHPTREGKVYCAVVLDTYSRRVVGWSIDASPTAALVTNGIGVAIDAMGPTGWARIHRDHARRPTGSPMIHSDQRTQYGSWAFTRRAQDAGLLPSMGAVGTCYDNALMESFWSRVQVELLDRQVWSTRLELATALFEYLEIFHNRQRRHSSLGMLAPIEFETRHASAKTSTVA